MFAFISSEETYLSARTDRFSLAAHGTLSGCRRLIVALISCPHPYSKHLTLHNERSVRQVPPNLSLHRTRGTNAPLAGEFNRYTLL